MFLFDVVVVLRPLLVKALKIINSVRTLKKVLNEKKKKLKEERGITLKKSSVESM